MTPPPLPPRYRKMPGHLRLLFGGASFWAAEDHFLLVRSSRFSEEYKRFFYTDIQGIAVAEAPRFHLSTRAMVLGALWTAAGIATLRWPLVSEAFGATGLLWILAWLLVSLLGSCRCRIYTAVSNDELPSVYRRWTARSFLATVEPLIAARQGTVPPDWAQIAEQTGAAPAPPPAAAFTPQGASRTYASDWMIGALFLAAGFDLAHIPAAFDRWTTLTGILAMVTGTVAVLVHRRKGLIQAAMQNLAIVALVSVGLLSYGHLVINAGIAGYRAGQSKSAIAVPLEYTEPSAMRPFSAGYYAILGIVGVVLSLRSGPAPNSPIPERTDAGA